MFDSKQEWILMNNWINFMILKNHQPNNYIIVLVYHWVYGCWKMVPFTKQWKMIVIDTMKIKMDDMVNLKWIMNVLMNMIWMVISFSILYEWFEWIHYVVEHFLYAIEMNGLCKPNHVMDHDTERLLLVSYMKSILSKVL